VYDLSGGLIARASLTNVFTRYDPDPARRRVTNLPPATYDVRAELAGFQTVIRKAPVRLNAVTEVDFTLSVGAALATEGQRTPDSLVHAADQALYEAKDAGRNCVRVWEDASSVSAR